MPKYYMLSVCAVYVINTLDWNRQVRASNSKHPDNEEKMRQEEVVNGNILSQCPLPYSHLNTRLRLSTEKREAGEREAKNHVSTPRQAVRAVCP